MTNHPDHLDLPARRHARGEVVLPGSKSISNRVLMLAALSEGATEMTGLLDSDDTRVMLAALATLGIGVEPLGGDRYRIAGGTGVFPNRDAKLFLGNAGTAFRPLTAVLAFAQGRYELSGVPRMHERPIGDLVDALRKAGCVVSYLAKQGYPPLLIEPGKPSAIDSIGIRGDVSSQFLSAMLMSLPQAAPLRRIEVIGELISKPYVDITTNLMARFGVRVARDASGAFAVPAGARYRSPGRIRVEGDASSASYFLAAGAIGGGPVRVIGVGRDSIQGDVRFAEALEKMGARITMGEDWIEAAAPATGKLGPIDADFNHIPDAAMTLAVLALFAGGPSVLHNIASWRVKETDRLAAMATELRKFGAMVEEGADFLRISPPAALRAPTTGIDTYDDHRIAMCFSLASLGGIPVTINEPRCVAKTFPDYFGAFAKVAA